jgi:hypothetical protein
MREVVVGMAGIERRDEIGKGTPTGMLAQGAKRT